jgi:phage portal protein BeeE
MGVIVDLVRASPKASPDKVPGASASMTTLERGKVGKANVNLYRNWAEHGEWVRAAIRAYKSVISASEWDIVPTNAETAVNERLRDELRELFDRPNPRADSFRSFIEPVIEDILVLDAGCIEKVPNLLGRVAGLYPVDGGTIRVNSFWDGSEPREPRYYWYPDYQQRASYTNDELVYIMSNPRTYSVIGLSPLETLKLTIDAELSSTEYNRRQVTSAAPDGIIDLGEGANPDTVEKFKSYWYAEVAGKGALGFIGNTKNAKFINFRNNNRDMQFLEWNIYLVRKITAVFGLTPQDLGVTFDVNRSTSEVQQEMTESGGFRPFMDLIQTYLTREVVWDERFGGKGNNLSFKFISLNLKENKKKADINHLALAGVSWKTINEARIDDGRAPLDGAQYDIPLVITPTGAVSLAAVPTASEVLQAKAAKAAAQASPSRPPSAQ